MQAFASRCPLAVKRHIGTRPDVGDTSEHSKRNVKNHVFSESKAVPRGSITVQDSLSRSIITLEK